MICTTLEDLAFPAKSSHTSHKFSHTSQEGEIWEGFYSDLFFFFFYLGRCGGQEAMDAQNLGDVKM